MADKETLVIGMVGDLLVDRENPREAFEAVGEILVAPDILFGNLEGTYSDDPEPPPGVVIQLFPKASNLGVFEEIGFDVLSMANNHVVDNGHAVMLDNIARLNQAGIKTCGAGENLEAARRPAIVDANGVKVAFLAYASTFQIGHEAGPSSPGLAPYRSYDYWQPMEDNYYLPGSDPKAVSLPNEGDLRNLKEDIRLAKGAADLVCISFHWGDYLKPFHLTEHERLTARLCIDAGADMIIGHHHHMIRGVESYTGKPVFYGLGHLVFDLPLEMTDQIRSNFTNFENYEDPDSYHVFPREGWPLLPLHADTRMTMIAFAEIEHGQNARVGMLPCRLRPNGHVEPVGIDNDEGREVIAYLEKCITSQKLDAQLECSDEAGLAGRKAVFIRSPVKDLSV
ncbi:MAG: CapA family protein [Xanthomonadales bacterium]|jgi:poly-gamma-glutamate synthesis protein (capsule biosynthesis protein)|nr:CapA family protein [Xanthomonadales bacterium]